MFFNMRDHENLVSLIKQFMPFAQKHIGFTRPPRLFLKQDHDINELRQIAKHNFELAWNKEYLIKLFADHLVKGQ